MIPEKVKIGPFDYKVEMVELVNEDNDHGQISYSGQSIKIKNGLAEQYTEHVLWHEIVHGILSYAGLENKEETVERLGHALYQVIVDNPLLFVKEAHCENPVA